MDDRKKKLELLKQRNEANRIKLSNTTSNQSNYQSNTNTPAIFTSTNNNPTSSISNIDQLIKETTKAPADINFEEIKRATKNLNKFSQDDFNITKMSQTFLRVKPELYEDGVQCNLGTSQYDSDLEDEDSTTKEKNVGYRRSVCQSKTTKKPTHNLNNLKESSKKPDNAFSLEERALAKTSFDKNEDISNVKIKQTISEDMRRQIIASQEFGDFLGTKSKYVERALGEKEIYDIFKTYYDEEDTNDVDLSKRSWVSPALEFVSDNCAGRAVTSLEWSLKHQELILAAYSKSDDFNVNQSNGLINLWSLALRKTPEFTFNCQTEITSAIFHKYIPKLVVGATYTGQILIWDTRGKPLPIQKTPPGGKFHSHPIYCLGVTGTTNANNIISVSNDGVLCTWSLSNLSKPTKRIELKVKKRKQNEGLIDSKIDRNYTEDIGAICLATQENESNNVFLGADDSDIYQIYVHQSNDNVDNIVETYKKHNGPIHSLHMHPGDSHKNSNFSHLMLSCSADWSVNLWSKNYSENPLFTFDNNDDYVYDAKFHPNNPSLFSCVDGMGKLDFWDLNKDLEVPVCRYDVGKNSLNKLSWSMDGKRIAVGDITGKVSVLNLDKELYNSKVEDSMKFEKIISMAKNTKKTY